MPYLYWYILNSEGLIEHSVAVILGVISREFPGVTPDNLLRNWAKIQTLLQHSEVLLRFHVRIIRKQKGDLSFAAFS
jgi:hypothetical protein